MTTNALRQIGRRRVTSGGIEQLRRVVADAAVLAGAGAVEHQLVLYAVRLALQKLHGRDRELQGERAVVALPSRLRSGLVTSMAWMPSISRLVRQ